MMQHRAVLGLGANLGDPGAALLGAVQILRGLPELHVVAVSSLYRTAPVGGPVQPDYCNAVMVVDTAVAAGRLLTLCHEIEQRFGRVRDVRWGPRTLDIDILAYGDQVSDDPALTLPHPRAHLRAFVLVPWAEVDPDFEIPGRGRVADLLERLSPDDRRGVVRLTDRAAAR